MGNVIFRTMNPATDRRPGVRIEFNFAGAQSLPGAARRVLYIGQMLTTGGQAGSATPGTPVQFFGYEDAEPLFGRGSMLAEMIRYGKMAEDYYDATVETWAVPLADVGGGVAATGSISFNGSNATEAGTLALYINGVQVPVGVSDGDTAATIATNTVAAINANTQLPVTAAVDGTHAYEVDLTLKWKGVSGNYVPVLTNIYPTSDQTPTGVVVAITALSGGTENPDITAVFTGIGDAWFTDIAMPYTDASNLTTLQTELIARWGGGGNMADGTGWAAYQGSASATDTFGESQDSQFLQVMGTGNNSVPQAPYIWAAVMAETYNISLELDPAQPLQYLQLPNILPPATADRFTSAERILMLQDGISTYTVDRSGNVITETVVTTWQTNAQGSPDTSYLYPEYVANLSYQRYALVTELASAFPRFKWSPVELTPLPPNVATPNLLRGELHSIGQDFQDEGLITNAAAYASTAVIETAEGNANAVAIIVNPDLIAGLRGMFIDTQFSE